MSDLNYMRNNDALRKLQEGVKTHGKPQSYHVPLFFNQDERVSTTPVGVIKVAEGSKYLNELYDPETKLIHSAFIRGRSEQVFTEFKKFATKIFYVLEDSNFTFRISLPMQQIYSRYTSQDQEDRAFILNVRLLGIDLNYTPSDLAKPVVTVLNEIVATRTAYDRPTWIFGLNPKAHKAVSPELIERMGSKFIELPSMRSVFDDL